MVRQSQSVTITLEGNREFDGFDCRGRSSNLCDGCRLRFLCLSERDRVDIPFDLVKKYKIKDMRSLVAYMYGEGKVSYELREHSKI